MVPEYDPRAKRSIQEDVRRNMKKSDTSKTIKKQEKDDDAVEIQKKKKNEEEPKPQLSPSCIYLDQQKNKVANEVPKKQSKPAFGETIKVSTSPRQPTKS